MGSGFTALTAAGLDLDPGQHLLAAAKGVVEHTAIGACDCQHQEFVGAHPIFPAISHAQAEALISRSHEATFPCSIGPRHAAAAPVSLQQNPR